MYVYMLLILTTHLFCIVYNKTIHSYVQNATYSPKVLIKIWEQNKFIASEIYLSQIISQ